MNFGTITIGSSTEQHVVIAMTGGEGSTINTMISPALARIYGAMLMSIADTLEPPVRAAASLGQEAKHD